jgi:chromosome condensin MukBEF ATPase and DNA-binding subunit MukB
MGGDMTTEQQIGALLADMNHVQEDVEEIKKDVREMRDILLKAQGGWRTLVILGTISAVLGGLVTKLIGFLAPLLPK